MEEANLTPELSEVTLTTKVTKVPTPDDTKESAGAADNPSPSTQQLKVAKRATRDDREIDDHFPPKSEVQTDPHLFVTSSLPGDSSPPDPLQLGVPQPATDDDPCINLLLPSGRVMKFADDELEDPDDNRFPYGIDETGAE